MATRPPRLSPGTLFCHTGPDGQRLGAFTAEEFWAWGFSNIQEGVLRGILAEFIVARAIGAPVQVRQSWDEADLVTADGVKVEVKSTGYLHAWADLPNRESRICFDGVRSRLWTPELGTALVSDYHSDVYVFCLQTARSRGGYHPLDLTSGNSGSSPGTPSRRWGAAGSSIPGSRSWARGRLGIQGLRRRWPE